MGISYRIVGVALRKHSRRCDADVLKSAFVRCSINRPCYTLHLACRCV